MSASLTERVWNAIPSTQLAFVRLLELLDVAESREVPTAAVTLGARSRLLVNPDFAAAHCTTDARLAMLVMHELFHVLLGHTRLFERVTPAQNLAFDAVINAHLCLLFPAHEHTALFRSLYRADRFPEALLRPPAGWRTREEHWQMNGAAGRVHRALYSETSVTYTELFALLAERVEGDGLACEPLLGSHGEGDAASADPDLTAAVRGIIAGWPMHERLSGRDEGGARGEERIRLRDPRAGFVATLRRALLPLLDLGGHGSGALRPAPMRLDTVLAYRTGTDRRGAVREAMGLPVLLHRAQIETNTLAPSERVHVYLDVSGSMSAVVPLVYAALAPFHGQLHEQVHLFSTEVCDVTPRDLGRGRVLGTGGTAIRCVTGHLIEQRIARALVVTDGWVGDVPKDHHRCLAQRRVRLGAVVTEPGETAFATALGARVHRFPAPVE